MIPQRPATAVAGLFSWAPAVMDAGAVRNRDSPVPTRRASKNPLRPRPLDDHGQGTGLDRIDVRRAEPRTPTGHTLIVRTTMSPQRPRRRGGARSLVVKRCRKPHFRRPSNDLISAGAISESPCREIWQDGEQVVGRTKRTVCDLLFTPTTMAGCRACPLRINRRYAGPTVACAERCRFVFVRLR